ncbi:hypothetical protein [Nannocystis pusilla]|uniref:Uncharacterized protein n=1 Tax=Nannocystis pusilla TaxID=889268 RepID=A0ABS7TX78_9BACT|nr:hypothetical protein [Nannocystis pusilla]MBZ5712818.1 hypothetical protein [Nannocystis pusilla]
MIHVGREFEIDKGRLRAYGWDYAIAMTAATFPWLMIPLKMPIVGLAWQMGATLAIMLIQLWIAWRWLHSLALPRTWPWVLTYAAALTAFCEAIYLVSELIDETVPIYLEVLLPAFVLGCVMRRDGEDAGPRERSVANAVSACFMALVGLSMPPFTGHAPTSEAPTSVSAGLQIPSWGSLALHTLAVTILSNIGKLFPLACYRREASLAERAALAVAMWPRGEVGAGVLVLGISYGLGGPMLAVASFSLALNLLLTGPYILLVKRLVTRAASGAPDRRPRARAAAAG